MARPLKARRPLVGWRRSVQYPEPLLEPNPVVAEPFRFAPVLVAGDVRPLLATEMPVEGLVVQEARPLTPIRPVLLEFSELPCVCGLPEIVVVSAAHAARGGRIRNRFAETFVAAQIFRRRIY